MGKDFLDINSLDKVYEGREPYIFISYAHKDSDRVLPVIEFLQKEGFRVWFDAGIEVGTEWPEYIAEHLYNCECAIAFVSRNFAKSRHCVKELRFAVSKEKNIFAVYLEDFEMSLGMQMQLEDVQAMFSYRHKTKESFMKTLAATRIIQPCRSSSEAASEKNTDFVNVEKCRTAITVDEETEKTPLKSERKTKKKTLIVAQSGSESERFAKENKYAFETLDLECKKTISEPAEENIFCTEEGKCGSNCTYKCYSNGELIISGFGDMDNYKSYLSKPWRKKENLITKIVIENGITSIGSFAFCAMNNVKEITIPESVKLINEGGISNLISLTEVTLPSSVGSIDFQLMSKNLKSVVICNSELDISELEFEGDTVIVAPSGSLAVRFATDNGIRLEYYQI